MLIGLLTAVAASICYGTGSVLQAVGSRKSARREAAAAGHTTGQVTAYGGPSLSSTAQAAMTWEFVVGTVLDFVGFGLGALAARLLPLFLSQTVISANLIITAVLSVKLLGIRLTGRSGPRSQSSARRWCCSRARRALRAAGTRRSPPTGGSSRSHCC